MAGFVLRVRHISDIYDVGNIFKLYLNLHLAANLFHKLSTNFQNLHLHLAAAYFCKLLQAVHRIFRVSRCRST